MTNSSKVEQPLIFSVLSIISIFIAVVAILGLINFFYWYNTFRRISWTSNASTIFYSTLWTCFCVN